MGLMNVAYCDESVDARTPRVFSVSGYLGRAPDWFDLERRWRIALREEALDATGFHMAPCEAGRKAPYLVSREERDRLQRRFIGIITDTKLWGYAIAIEEEAYRRVVTGPKAGDYTKPYYLAFQAVIERMSLVLEQAQFPKSERVAFVFDQQQEYQGKAMALYEMLQQSTVNYGHRLGSLTFDNRFASLQLQAADVLAYESMRHFRGGRLQAKPTRWQFELLKPSVTEVRFYSDSHIKKLATRAGWTAGD